MGAPEPLLADRYRVDDVVAEGPISRLLLARDRRSGAHVAIEQYSVGLSQRARMQLSQWVTRARRVDSPYVGRVLAHSVDPLLVVTAAPEGLPLPALTWVIGRLAPERASRIAADIARGFEALHRAGVVWGALDPSHVMLDDAERAALIGFPSHLEGASPAGRWASPELARGEAPSPAADLYSLGVILAEMTGGEMPPTEDPESRQLLAALREEHSSARPASAGAVAEALSRVGLARAIPHTRSMVTVPDTRSPRTTPASPRARDGGRTKTEPSATTGARAAAPRFVTGDRVAGRYRVEGLLGRGGFAEVYRVRDESRGDAPRALKLHRLRGRPAQMLAAIEAEFSLLASLSHPNLAAVHDFGVIGERLAYFTQEIIEGVPLSRAGLELGEPRTIRLLAQLCRALDYLHARGVLHRDVKGANLLVDPECEHLTLLDFGIARAFGASDGMIMGTVGFLAPEAFSGGALDGRADLYATGVVLHRMVTGRVPYRGSPSEIVQAQLTGEPPRIARSLVEAGRLTEGMARLIERLLAREPAARHASAGELLGDLATVSGVDLGPEPSDALASYVLSAPTVGRDHARATLAGQTAKDAVGVVTALVGAGGTGKSRLLRDRRVEVLLERRRWVEARALPGDGGRALIADLAREIVSGRTAARLAEDDRIELARALPELRRPGEHIAVAVDPERARRARLSALASAMRLRFARASGVVVIEDLHHADPSVAAQLAGLIQASREVEAPATFVVAARPSPTLEAFLSAVPSAARVEAAPLPPGAGRQLVAGVFGDASILDGTPLAAWLDTPRPALDVQEAIRLALDRGDIVRRQGRWRVESPPPAQPLEEVVRARVALRSEAARQLLRGAAVVGRPATLATLGAVSGLGAAEVTAASGELVRSGLMDASPSGAGPATYEVHDRFAEVAMAGASLEAIHAQASAHLAADADADWRALDRAAWHARMADDVPGAIALLERGLEVALAAGRPDASLEMLRRLLALLDEPSPVRWWIREHDLARQAGLGAAARDAMDRMVAAAEAAPPMDRQQIALREARALADAGDGAAAREKLEPGLAWAQAHEERDLELQWRLLAGRVESEFGRLEVAKTRFEDAAALAEQLGATALEARARIGASYAAFYLSDLDAGVAQATRAVAATDMDDPALLSEALRSLSTGHRGRGELLESTRLLHDAVAAARACGSIVDEAKALNNLSIDASRLGDIPVALRAARRSIQLKEQLGTEISADITRCNLGYMLAGLGRVEEARALLEKVRARAQSRHVLNFTLSNLGEIAARAEALDEAHALFTEGLASADRHGFTASRVYALTGLVRVELMRGEVAEAATRLEALAEVCADLPFERCRLKCTEALVRLAEGEEAAALRCARDAADDPSLTSYLFGTFGSRLEARWVLCLCAHRAGRVSEARDALSRARLDVTWLGATLEPPYDEVFREGHPMRRAILAGERDLEPGWTWPEGWGA